VVSVVIACHSALRETAKLVRPARLCRQSGEAGEATAPAVIAATIRLETGAKFSSTASLADKGPFFIAKALYLRQIDDLSPELCCCGMHKDAA
jgi:hypothetical protein